MSDKLIPRQYYIGVFLGALVITLLPLGNKIPFVETPNLVLFLMFPILGGAVAGFIMGKGVLEGLIAGLLAGIVGGVMLGITGTLITLIQSGSFDLSTMLNGTLELTLLLATPAIIGGLIGGGARKIQEIIRNMNQNKV
jgi:hypothetical protein